MTKKIYIKQDAPKKKKERYCLNCGINISHRSKDVKFCCPACKAQYKQNYDYMKDAKPELPKRKMVDTEELPYSSYQADSEQTCVTSDITQTEKLYARYTQNKGECNGLN